MSHPTLGLPPRDLTAGFPADAARLRDDRLRLATRALEAAASDDPTLQERYDELGLRRLLNDAAVLLDAVVVAVASADPGHVSHWADTSIAPYRRRRVPMDDLIVLAEGLRRSIATALEPAARAVADAGLDDAIGVWRRARGLGGDARKRNPIIHAIYKGA